MRGAANAAAAAAPPRAAFHGGTAIDSAGARLAGGVVVFGVLSHDLQFPPPATHERVAIAEP